MALLEAVQLTKIFRHPWTMRAIPVLEDVSLSLREGEVLGLIGPNGAGKTTTIKLLLYLLRPTRGRVEFLGSPVSRRETRRHIGFLPEQPYFYDYLTVEETLQFYGQLCGLSALDRRRRVDELVERLQLSPFRRYTMRQLSKGNLQRVGIIQAILNRPRLAILDEPMSGLDPTGRKEMRDLIQGLHAEGTTVIFSSHILPDAEALCDRVAILAAGRLREVVDLSPGGRTEGPFELVVSNLSLASVAELNRLAARPGIGGPEQWSFRFRDRASVQQATALIAAAHGFIESLSPEQPSLEERLLSHAKPGTGTA
jgi:ABC-2 type transport system ATP-binding protein